MSTHRLFWPCVALLCLGLAAGCGADAKPAWRPTVVPAGGVVRFQGHPLEGALVTFSNAKLGASASGRTDAEGKFTLTTFESADGAVPGKNMVSVSKVQTPDQVVDKSSAPMVRNARTGPPRQNRWLIPKRYGNASTSGLTVDVGESGSTDIVLELQGAP
jgi:hypothetical protein